MHSSLGLLSFSRKGFNFIRDFSQHFPFKGDGEHHKSQKITCRAAGCDDLLLHCLRQISHTRAKLFNAYNYFLWKALWTLWSVPPRVLEYFEICTFTQLIHSCLKSRDCQIESENDYDNKYLQDWTLKYSENSTYKLTGFLHPRIVYLTNARFV